MTDVKDNSSLPLLFSITGAILLVAVGGWFFLEQQESEPATTQSGRAAEAPTSAISNAADAPVQSPRTLVENEPEVDPVVEQNDTELTGADADLRLARLAADADILVLPATQSALHYYGRILDADPGHAIANAELDTILARVAQTVTQHLEDRAFVEAHEIAALVAKQRPEHSLVIETQQTLDNHTEQLIQQAIQNVRDGNDDRAGQLIAAAEGLPGRNPDYFIAIRESIAEIQAVRQSADRDRNERARLADNKARAAWVARIRTAIAQGNLIEPAGASARDLLAERNSWSAERNQLRAELLAALIDAAKSHLNAQRLDDADALLSAAVELGGRADELNQLRDSLERAFIDARSNQLVAMSELVQVKSVAPRYPRRASRSNLSGWVDVVFTITPSGATSNVEVFRAEPESLFDNAAIDAVSEWEFQPVEYRGQVISQRAGARLVFQIE
ncbi:MAG: energy transducer TonB [Gammaproteobacteria bacterium]|nr:energy transducer TonB [Gammaproteobacteria bacterium]